MTKNISECDMFIKKYYDISWRYARYDLEYENKKKEYNKIKEKVFDEYINHFLSCEYNFKEANRLACININKSQRVNNKYNELLEIKDYKDNTEKNYNYLYNYYIHNV